MKVLKLYSNSAGQIIKLIERTYSSDTVKTKYSIVVEDGVHGDDNPMVVELEFINELCADLAYAALVIGAA